MRPSDDPPVPSFPSLPDAIASRLLDLLGADPTERKRAVDELCDASPELAQEIRHSVEQVAEAAAEPKHVGPYPVSRVLGAGGMGTVYLGEQLEPVRRPVAVKVIKLGMDSEAVLRRFERERQALAVMSHDGIAKVFDAGRTERGQPYFAMEYVDGVPLTNYCDDRRLSVRDRVRLFQRVCAGVQHAHHKGVIHRDLKPANILVAEDQGLPVPKIIDFGLARAVEPSETGATLFTRNGEIVGTPEYMSPEQLDPAGSDVDTRTDVYSLGVTLYELLVGSLPFPSPELRLAPVADVRRRILQENPPKPSTRLTQVGAHSAAVATSRGTSPSALRRAVQGDLDWIVLKAMSKNPDRRYESPAALAADLDRYLGFEPVVAGPPSTTYRLRMFVRRYRGQVAAGLAILAALLGGTVTSFVFLADARAEASHARAINEYWAKLLTSVDPDADGRDVRLIAVLEKAERELPIEFPGQPGLEAQVLQLIGETYHSLGRLLGARRLLEAALDQHGVAGSDPQTVAPTQLSLGNVLVDLGAHEQAEMLYRAALLGARRSLDRQAVFAARQNLAQSLWDRGQLEQAEPKLRELVRDSSSELGPSHRLTLTAMQSLAVLLTDDGRAAEAEPLLRQVVLVRRLGLGPEQSETLSALNALGVALLKLNRFEDAQQTLAEVHRLQERHLGPTHHSTLNTLNNLASVAARLGRYEEAAESFRQVVRSEEVAYGAEHRDPLSARNNLAWALAKSGRHAEALAELERIVEVADRLWPDGDSATSQWRLNYGGALVEARSFEVAERQLQRSLEEMRRSGPREQLGQVRAALHRLYEDWGRPADAAKWR